MTEKKLLGDSREQKLHSDVVLEAYIINTASQIHRTARPARSTAPTVTVTCISMV